MGNQFIGRRAAGGNDRHGSATQRRRDRGRGRRDSHIHITGDQSIDRSGSRSDLNQPNVQPVLLEKPRLLGDPQRPSKPRHPRIGNNRALQLRLLGQGKRVVAKSRNQTGKEKERNHFSSICLFAIRQTSAQNPIDDGQFYRAFMFQSPGSGSKRLFVYIPTFFFSSGKNPVSSRLFTKLPLMI